MNEQLLPVDTELSSQLARRAAGRMPEGLLSDVIQAVDSAQERPGLWRRPRPTWRAPQFALGAASAGLATVLVAVLVIAPLTQPRPAGPAYPADRALTTAELAKLMSGPALATNTALVADVTIDANPDVCPMNRYPTLGVVAAMGSQVCVMASGVSTGMTGSSWTGIFAFRYLAPGYLGLLGQVDPASNSKLAYGATDQWPLLGKVFLVDGWLGSSGLCEASRWVDPEPGDVLNPTGPEPCSESWISDKPAPQAYRNYRDPSASVSAAPTRSLSPSDNRLAQVEDLYWVGAGGMRYYDDLSGKFTQPVRGTWAVTNSVGPCPNEPPTSSRGCGYWLVLARISDVITGPLPTAFLPTPSPTVPISGMRDSAATPLTTAELGLALKAGIPDGNVVIVTTTIADSKSCTTSGLTIAIGAIPGMVPEVCVLTVNDSDPAHFPANRAATFAFKVLAPRLLGYMATIEPKSRGGAYTPDDVWPAGQSIVVSGWITPNPGNDPLYAKCEGLMGEAAGSLDPASSYCSPAKLASSKTSSSAGVLVAQALTVDEIHAIQNPGKGASPVPAGAYPMQGSWLVQPFKPDGTGPKPAPGATGLAACCTWQISGKIDPVGLAATDVPATPIPEPAAPTATPLAARPIQRAMTTAELAVVLSGPAPAIGTTFVANVTIEQKPCPQGDMVADGVLQGMGSQICVQTAGLAGSKASGTFALRYRDTGLVMNLGRVEPASSCRLLFNPTDTWPGGITESHTFLVGGYLVKGSAGWVVVATPNEPATPGAGHQTVELDTDAGFTTIDPSRYGVFVVTSVWTAVPSSGTEPSGDGVAYHLRAWVSDTSGPAAEPSAPTSVCGPEPSV